ncbi:MAG: M15 family metallopeptidase [Clostridia bacterium]|nr:M15 family metallopeptidase [Clostridia bacterium]
MGSLQLKKEGYHISRDTTLLHPQLQEICETFIAECRKQGLTVGISQTWRTKAEQDDLYAQGRTKPGVIVTKCRYPNSPHNWGVAFDIYRNDGKGAYADNDGWFKKCGQIGKKLGLCWGGDFKSFVDKPHFELPEYLPGSSCKTLLARYRTPENFKKTWKEHEMTQEQFDKMMDDYLSRREKAAVSAWARTEMAEAIRRGITDGKRPGSFATREEVAVMALRAAKKEE